LKNLEGEHSGQLFLKSNYEDLSFGISLDFYDLPIHSLSALIKYFSLQSNIVCKTGSRLQPNSVSEYSTLGETSGYTVRVTIPADSNSRSCNEF
jgi:hypothetical protein